MIADGVIQQNDDGVIDAKEKKAIQREKKRQLQMRHRMEFDTRLFVELIQFAGGIMQYQTARTGLWAKEGVSRRITTMKQKVTGTTVRKRESFSRFNARSEMLTVVNSQCRIGDW